MNIQKSKLVVVEKKFANAGRTYCWIVFSTNPSNISCENCLLERKFNFGQKRKIKCFSHILSTNCIGKLFLTIKKCQSSKNVFYGTSFFFREYLTKKNLEITKHNRVFFTNYLSSLLFNNFFFSNIFAIITCSASTCFFREVFPFFL